MSTTFTTDTTRIAPQARLGHDVSAANNLTEALNLADLNWQVREEPADGLSIFTDDELITTSIPDRKLLLRSDNLLTLGVVGNRYQPVSNADAFGLADAAHQLGARFAHAGELDYGRKTYMTMTIPEADVLVGGKDLVSFGLTLRTDHSGSGSITGSVDGTRLVCTNGMRGRLTSPQSWTIRHTATADQRLEMAEDALQHAFAYAKEFAAVAEEMISTPMTRREFYAFIDEIFPEPDEEAKRKHAIWAQRRQELVELFRLAETQEEGRGTRWAGYNALVEWLDWFRPSRGGDEGRALRNFNTSADTGLGARAFDMLAN